MQHMIAFSGRKQSGKNTCAKFIIAAHLKELGVVHGTVERRNEGVFVSDILGDTSQNGILVIEDSINFIRETTGIGLYSFADSLKQKVCVDILGLKPEQCFGADEQKNTNTDLFWENMPGVFHKPIKTDSIKNWEIRKFRGAELIYHEPGRMTAREVLQFVGTNVFRKMYYDVWVDTLMRTIEQDTQSWLVIITDCRFPNEANAIRLRGGKIIRLDRHTEDFTKIESEMALDDYKGFDAIIDNREMTIEEQEKEVYKLLRGWDIMNIPFFDKLLEVEDED